MASLTDLPNISTVNAKKLQDAGITTPEMLRKIGSREAFLRVRATSDPGACLSMLQGLEGAIQGIRWHSLSPETKAELKCFFNSVK